MWPTHRLAPRAARQARRVARRHSGRESLLYYRGAPAKPSLPPTPLPLPRRSLLPSAAWKKAELYIAPCCLHIAASRAFSRWSRWISDPTDSNEEYRLHRPGGPPRPHGAGAPDQSVWSPA